MDIDPERLKMENRHDLHRDGGSPLPSPNTGDTSHTYAGASTWTTEQWVEHGRAWRALGWAPSSVSWAAILIGMRGDTCSAYSTSGLLRPDGTVYSDYFVEWVPDMRDPGTLGHALALVREVWGSSSISVRWCESMGEWCCEDDVENGWRFWRASEAEALLAAREAAP